jgi:alpha-tubulin suppressor-like RCC1 family protein
LTGVVAIAAGYHRSVALTSDGEVVAWGEDTYGDSTVPPGLNNVVAISASGASGRHTLVLKDDGTVSGFGVNNVHQLDIPLDLAGVVAVSAGSSHSLALKSNGTVVAWGYNYGGMISVPPDLTDVVAISAGNGFSLALKSDGTIVGWGMNNYGVLDIPESLNLLLLHGEGGTIFPDRPIGASPGSVLQFTLTPEDGFTPVVDGTCGGTLTGDVFTTNPITADCTVEASFVSGDDGCHFFVLPGVNGKAAVICL